MDDLRTQYFPLYESQFPQTFLHPCPFSVTPLLHQEKLWVLVFAFQHGLSVSQDVELLAGSVLPPVQETKLW